jgi:hypothetical protein
VKVTCFRDLSVRTKSGGIVIYYVACLSKNAGPFLQKRMSARASWPWAMFGLACRPAPRGPQGAWGQSGGRWPFVFSKTIS